MSNKFYNDSSNNVATNILASIGVLLVSFILGTSLFLYGILTVGFVGGKLWAWYIVPVFGLKSLTIVQAWGIALLVGLWTKNTFVHTNKDERETSEKIGHSIGILLAPWISLLIGWIGTFLL